jgi:hypothetical protein
MPFIHCRHNSIFTQSVNNTNITVHILQCVTVMNLDTLQHFPQIPLQHHIHTQHCISQTVWTDLKVAPVLMHWDICMYIGYQQFIFWYLMEERLRFNLISLLSFKWSNIRVLWRSLLRHCIWSRKVASSNPLRVTYLLHGEESFLRR